MLAAQGALWLDEAVSAIYAHEAGTPIGVFLNINHDNNHHLNSLWLQLVGFDSHPLLQRALSIASSTVAIVLAGMIGARRAPLIGLIAAALFALSPMLVTLGSEARGYAPLSVAVLGAILLIDRWVAGEAKDSPAVSLGLCFLLGALSHLAMAFAFCALAGWVVLVLWRRDGLAAAIRRSIALFVPSALALGLVVAIIWGAAAASPKGYAVGGYTPFSWQTYLDGVSQMIGYTLGWTSVPDVGLVLLPAAVALGVVLHASRMPFHALAILAFPLAILILQPGNVALGRYYILTSFALLILTAEITGLAIAAGGWKRWLSIAALAAFGIASLSFATDLIRNQRADIGAAIRAMEARAPAGAQVVVERELGLPHLITAAASAHYPLRVMPAEHECPASRFVFVDRFYFETFPAALRRCDHLYAPIAGARAIGISGSDWKLYEIQP